MKMNKHAEDAFINLPRAISQIDMGMVYMFKRPIDAQQDAGIDHDFTQLKSDLTHLIQYYVDKGFMKQEQVKGVGELLASPDKENWLVAFTIVDVHREKQWNPKQNINL